MSRIVALALLLLSACAERPVREGTLPGGETFREYSRVPYGYTRIIYAPDGRELGRQQLHTEQNFKRIQPGMTREQVAEIVGLPVGTAQYANATSSATWRYYDGIYKLLHVIFGPDDRVLRYETEWDPNIYSKNR